MTRFLRQLSSCLLILLGTAISVHAHQYPDFDNSLGLTIDQNTITLEYRIWYGPVLIPGLDIDTTHDSRLDDDELYAFMEKTDREIRDNLDLFLDKAPLAITPLTATISDNGQYPQISLDIALWYTARIAPAASGPERLLEIRDANFAAYGPARKLVFINTASRAGDIRVTREKDLIRVAYTDAADFGMTSHGKSPGTVTRPDRDNRLTDFLREGTAGPAMLFAAFATAFILGAGHALSPGHGKAMVAAYLVGTRGRKRDAVFLGIVVTFTHVISVILLGLIVLYLSTRILPEQIFPWLSVASGILVFMTGFVLLARRRSAHHHGPHHLHTGTGEGHEHHHDAKDPVSGPGLLSLLSMGIAGGMVPCPSAMVVLLVSISLHKIALGLALITVFSLGLAAVLIGIGIAVVSVSGISSAIDRFAPLVNLLPLFGAGLVLILGIFITAQGLVAAGIIRLIPM